MTIKTKTNKLIKMLSRMKKPSSSKVFLDMKVGKFIKY